MILNCCGSAKVSLDLITSSRLVLNLRHSSMYILISISVSWVLVFFRFLFSNSTSSAFTLNSCCYSLTFLFKFTTRWFKSNFERGPPYFTPSPVYTSYWSYRSSSIILSLRESSFSVCNSLVFSFKFSSFKQFEIRRDFMTSSYKRSRS